MILFFRDNFRINKLSFHLSMFCIILIMIFSTLLLFSKTILAVNIPSYEDIADYRFEYERDQYLEDSGWELGESTLNPNNAYIGWGDSYIYEDKSDEDYEQKRIEAFERAFSEAKSDLLESKEAKVTVKEVKEVLDGNVILNYINSWKSQYGPAPYFKDEYKLSNSLLEEKFVLFELIEMVNDKKINNMTITKIDSQGKLSGVMVESTFETEKRIGVLIKHSNQTEDVAASMAGEKNKNLFKNYESRIHISRFENLEDEDLVFIHGIRIIENNEGENILLGFGQWPAKSKQTEHIKSAKNVALTRAKSAIAQFIETEIYLNSKSATVFSDPNESELYPSFSIELAELYIMKKMEIWDISKITEENFININSWKAENPITGELLVGKVIQWTF